MDIGQTEGSKIKKVFDYMKDNPHINWKKPSTNAKLREEFPDISGKLLSKYRYKYLRQNDIKKISEKEIMKLRAIIMWWDKEKACDPLKSLIPRNEAVIKKTYVLGKDTMDEIDRIANANDVLKSDLVEHILKRFVNDYHAYELSNH